MAKVIMLANARREGISLIAFSIAWATLPLLMASKVAAAEAAKAVNSLLHLSERDQQPLHQTILW